MPIIIEIIDSQEKIEMAMPIINEMVNEGLVLITDVMVLKYWKELTEEEKVY